MAPASATLCPRTMYGGSAPVTKWQHAWISVDPGNRDDIAKLETMGNEGWELVSVQPWGTSIFMMFFKRPKSE